MCLGDFNAILGSHEQKGGRITSASSCLDFRNWSDCCSLTHLPTRGAQYTWSNRRSADFHIERRLDRSLCNEDWINLWSSISCVTLTRTQSDHHPLLISLKQDCASFPKTFKFQSMWVNHYDCRRLVLEVWNRHYIGCPMIILS